MSVTSETFFNDQPDRSTPLSRTKLGQFAGLIKTEARAQAATDVATPGSDLRAELDVRLGSVVAAGAGDGVADDRAALAAADTAAGTTRAVVLRPGTHRVSTSLTITAPVVMQPGAIIKPDSGVTVTLAGGLDAPLVKVFDHSAGGIVIPKRVDYWHPAWWGPTGTTDDSAAWTDMAAALVAGKITDSTTSAKFGQRILAPAGTNRFFGVTLAHCELVAHKGVSIFYPSGNPTTGSMLTIGDYCTVSGGFWRTNGASQAVTLLNYQGYRSKVEDVYLVPIAAGSKGLVVGSGVSITPVLSNVQINPGTLARVSTGIVMNAADAELTDIWVAQCDVGIEWQIGAARGINVHVWGCNTGMAGAMDECEFVNLFLDSNLGWGLNIDRADKNVFTNLRAWNNGHSTPSTGGVRLGRTGGTGSARDNAFIGGYFDDNVGVGLLLDDVQGTEVNGTRFASRSMQAGTGAVCDVGVQVTSTCAATNLHIRGRRSDHITAVVDNASTSTTVELASVTRTLAADQAFTASTAITTILSIPMDVGERWVIDGYLAVDGPQAADIKLRLQGTSLTGVSGYFTVVTAPAASNTSTTAASINPSVTAAIATGAGAAPIAGLLGVGTVQGLTIRGFVTTGTNAGSLDLQTAQNTSDAGTLTIRAGSWLRATRIA